MESIKTRWCQEAEGLTSVRWTWEASEVSILAESHQLWQEFSQLRKKTTSCIEELAQKPWANQFGDFEG